MLFLSACGGGGGGEGGGIIPSLQSFLIGASLPNTAINFADYLDEDNGPYSFSIVSGPGQLTSTGVVTVDGSADFDNIIVEVTDPREEVIRVRIPVIGNPVNWFMASELKDDVTTIEQWQDYSSNNNHAAGDCLTNKCPVLQPSAINEQHALYFDGIDDQLDFDSNGITGNATFFIILKSDGVASSTGLNWFEKTGILSSYNGVATHYDFGISLNSDGRCFAGYRYDGGTISTNSTVSLFDDKPHLIALMRNQVSGSFSQFLDVENQGNGVGASTLLSENPTQITIGHIDSRYFAGHIAEILIYDTSLSIAQREVVERYLKDKYSIGIDPTKIPDVIIDSVPADPTSNMATFNFTVNATAYADIVSLECHLVGSSWTNCSDFTEFDFFGLNSYSSSITYNNLSDSTHIFEIKATDSDGKTDIETFSFVIDTQAPTCTISSPQDGGYNNEEDPIVIFSCSDNNTITSHQCEINNSGSWNECTTPTTQTITGLNTDDITIVSVKAQDQYGQWSPTATTTFTTDRDLPNCTFSTSPSGVQINANETFVYSCLDNNTLIETVQCSLDGNLFTNCGSDTVFNWNDLNAGNHSLTIQITDVAGNITTQTANWQTDLVPPNCVFSGPVNEDGYDNNDMPIVTFSCSDDNVLTNNAKCSLNSGATIDCDTNTSESTVVLPEGTHNLQISITDVAGNTISKTLNWSIDLTNPSCVFTYEETGEVLNPLAHFEYSCSDPISSGVSSAVNLVECSFDGGIFANCDSFTTHDLSGLPDGVHFLRVRPTDFAGNVGSYIQADWTSAALPPTISSSYSNATYPSSLFVTLTPSKTTTMYYCIAIGSCCDPKSSGILYVDPIETSGANGNYCLSYYGIDGVMQESIEYTNNYNVSRYENASFKVSGELPVNGNIVRELSGGIYWFGIFRNSSQLNNSITSGNIEDTQADQKIGFGFDRIIN